VKQDGETDTLPRPRSYHTTERKQYASFFKSPSAGAPWHLDLRIWTPGRPVNREAGFERGLQCFDETSLDLRPSVGRRGKYVCPALEIKTSVLPCGQHEMNSG